MPAPAQKECDGMEIARHCSPRARCDRQGCHATGIEEEDTQGALALAGPTSNEQLEGGVDVQGRDVHEGHTAHAGTEALEGGQSNKTPHRERAASVSTLQ